MDTTRFDTLVRDIARTPGTHRRKFMLLVGGLVGGLVIAPIAQVETVEGRCRKGQHNCKGKCCPDRGPVCCKSYCCKKGYKCCGGGKCCRK